MFPKGRRNRQCDARWRNWLTFVLNKTFIYIYVHGYAQVGPFAFYAFLPSDRALLSFVPERRCFLLSIQVANLEPASFRPYAGVSRLLGICILFYLMLKSHGS